MGCVSSTGGDAHGDKTQTPYAALREGEMKLLLGNPGGGFANAWYCTGGCSADLICSDIDVDRAKICGACSLSLIRRFKKRPKRDMSADIITKPR
jgi:hypothetical protein